MPGYPPIFAPPPAPQKNNSGLAIGLGIGAIVLVIALLGTLVAFGKTGSGPFAFIGPTPTPAATATPTVTPTPTLTPTPTAPPTPIAPAGFTGFVSPDGVYSMVYPSSWIQSSQTASGQTQEIFQSSDGFSGLVVVPVSGSIQTGAYGSYLKLVLQQTPGTSNVVVSSAVTSVTIGGNRWTRATGTFDLQGQAATANLYGVGHNGGTYIAIAIGVTSSFAAINKADFQVMLQNFTFLK